jgi:hypothetical protein
MGWADEDTRSFSSGASGSFTGVHDLRPGYLQVMVLPVEFASVRIILMRPLHAA